MKRKVTKPVVVLRKAADPNSTFAKDWGFFDRYKTEGLALSDIINRLTISDLYQFKIKGKDEVYIQGNK